MNGYIDSLAVCIAMSNYVYAYLKDATHRAGLILSHVTDRHMYISQMSHVENSM